MAKNSCSNANRKAMILGFLLGASYHLLSFGAVMAAAQMETNWGVVQKIERVKSSKFVQPFGGMDSADWLHHGQCCPGNSPGHPLLGV
ncbi:expressed unknown protein [Seminavis robusta]|uniref:Uncharacterized protein n=1 Tax=Seminavis robusta TaxID=568900 RepID=A0A9N8HRM2_9STRA|nr:expressed unknown protein [Seminavis robusta]|eukprot:Sro1593_g284470.1 n/a (88) ;mRNA; r:1685-2040